MVKWFQVGLFRFNNSIKKLCHLLKHNWMIKHLCLPERWDPSIQSQRVDFGVISMKRYTQFSRTKGILPLRGDAVSVSTAQAVLAQLVL